MAKNFFKMTARKVNSLIWHPYDCLQNEGKALVDQCESFYVGYFNDEWVVLAHFETSNNSLLGDIEMLLSPFNIEAYNINQIIDLMNDETGSEYYQIIDGEICHDDGTPVFQNP